MAVGTTAKITADKVAALLRDVYKRGPWPDATACGRLARFLVNVAADIEGEEKAHRALKQRRKTIGASKRLISEQRRKLEADQKVFTGYAAFKPFRAIITAANADLNIRLSNLADLDAMLAKAEPALLWPNMEHRNARAGSLWHGLAFGLVFLTADALSGVRHGPISLDRRGPFIRFVAKALNLATGKQRPAATVATALRKTWLGKTKIGFSPLPFNASPQ
ncbi:MAG: hypothetical protein ACREEL_08400 [Stellaceae bacterium]